MPSATNLTVKDGAATPADKTFTLYSPAAGDGGVATWALKEGAVANAFPTFTAGSTKTSKGRQLKTKLVVPIVYTDSQSNMPMVIADRFEVNVTVAVPDSVPEARRDDCAAFAVNLLSHTLVKSMIRDGLPAT